jgi:CheY-like chemotaxis protein
MMSLRNIKMLHVEDDVSQRLLVAKHLASLSDYSIAITRAATEITAVAEFGKASFDFVLMDYHLAQGNGLSCLRKLRQINASVPIVAISGVATPEVIEQLKQAGADEFINKQTMQKDSLLQCVQRVLARTNLRADLDQICKSFAEIVPPELFGALDDWEVVAKAANMTPAQLRQLFESIAREIDANRPADQPPAKRLLRPLLADLIAGLVGLPGEVGGAPAPSGKPT